MIVDEFTGRVMPEPLGDGQHQAIEAKEACRFSGNPDPGLDHLPELLPPLSALGRYDRYGQDGRGEFEKTYKLDTIVPTNRVRARQDWADQVYKTEAAKWRAVANETADIHKKGRPVLVGTTSVEKSELLSLCWRSRTSPTICSTPSRKR